MKHNSLPRAGDQKLWALSWSGKSRQVRLTILSSMVLFVLGHDVGRAAEALGAPLSSEAFGKPATARGVTTVRTARKSLLGQRASAAPQAYDHGDPTPEEQLMLELINRARSDPQKEAARLGIDLNEGLALGSISADAKPPLAFNPALIDSSRRHSQWMLDEDIFEHAGASGTSPGDRMKNAGYPFRGTWAWAENIGWRGTTGAPDMVRLTTAIHDGLFRSPGHRKNLMNPELDEIGLGVLSGVFTSSMRDYNAVMATQNFAASDGTPGPFLLGVVYQDKNGDGVYSVGEGISGVMVEPLDQAYYAVTSASGGYAIPVTANSRSLGVSISGGVLTTSITRLISVTDQNVKLDFEILSAPKLAIDLATARWSPGGRFEFEVVGGMGQPFQVQSSVDLQTWTVVSSGRLDAARRKFVQESGDFGATRFYRVTTP